MAAEVTLEHLLSHTSGVYDYYDEEVIDDFDNFEMPVPGDKLETLEDYLPMLDGPMKFVPGERFSYSNESKLPVIGGSDGGAFTTTSDIEKLWLALLDNRILSAKLTKRFTTPSAQYKDAVHYGCGVWIDQGTPHPGRARLYVEGADAGVSFFSSIYDDGSISTVVSNTSEGAWTVEKAIHAFDPAHMGS